jgi:hypothetical protein
MDCNHTGQQSVNNRPSPCGEATRPSRISTLKPGIVVKRSARNLETLLISEPIASFASWL